MQPRPPRVPGCPRSSRCSDTPPPSLSRGFLSDVSGGVRVLRPFSCPSVFWADPWDWLPGGCAVWHCRAVPRPTLPRGCPMPAASGLVELLWALLCLVLGGGFPQGSVPRAEWQGPGRGRVEPAVQKGSPAHSH